MQVDRLLKGIEIEQLLIHHHVSRVPEQTIDSIVASRESCCTRFPYTPIICRTLLK
jgi:hypothetical protein